MKIKLAALFLSLVSLTAYAGPNLVCQSSRGSELMIKLDAGKIKGKIVSCISGDDWAVDGNACSANGFYALSANSGLVHSYVKRWQDAGEFDSSTYFGKNNEEFLFSNSGYGEFTSLCSTCTKHFFALALNNL